MTTARRLLARTYQKAAAPLGHRALERMLGDGLPPRLEGPLRALFGGELLPAATEAARRIERRRAELASSAERYHRVVHADPFGAARWPDRPAGDESGDLVTAATLATKASVPARWGMFLHLCAEAFEARTVVELGACLGISGAYLASGRTRPRLVTIEASPVLAPIAEATLAEVTGSAEVVRGTFSGTLERVLERHGPVDLAHIDGHHDEVATLYYVRTIARSLAPGALLVLDDIHLYHDMWRAWRSAVAMRGVTAAVNVGRFGLLLWEGGEARAREFDLSRYTGWWRVRGTRHQAMAHS